MQADNRVLNTDITPMHNLQGSRPHTFKECLRVWAAEWKSLAVAARGVSEARFPQGWICNLPGTWAAPRIRCEDLPLKGAWGLWDSWLLQVLAAPRTRPVSGGRRGDARGKEGSRSRGREVPRLWWLFGLGSRFGGWKRRPVLRIFCWFIAIRGGRQKKMWQVLC